MNGHIWASIDPIKNSVDVYPGWVSNKIEKELDLTIMLEIIIIPLGLIFSRNDHLKMDIFIRQLQELVVDLG